MKKYISLALKIIVIVFAVTGTILSASAGTGSFMGGTTVFMYFTIQSNIALALIALIGLILMLTKTNVPNWWYVIKYIGTVSITLTGGVFAFVLAPTMGPGAWVPMNVFTHVIVPIASIADFFVVGTESDIKKKQMFLTTIPPLMYVIYAAIGYVANWDFMAGANYPYFFLNWGSEAGAFGFSSNLPFMGCVWWILLLLGLILLFSYLYLVILDKLKKHSK